jgi:hypothetical protein
LPLTPSICDHTIVWQFEIPSHDAPDVIILMIIGIMVKKLRMAEYSVDIARFPKMGIELTEGSWRGALFEIYPSRYASFPTHVERNETSITSTPPAAP